MPIKINHFSTPNIAPLKLTSIESTTPFLTPKKEEKKKASVSYSPNCFKYINHVN